MTNANTFLQSLGQHIENGAHDVVSGVEYIFGLGNNNDTGNNQIQSPNSYGL